MPKNSDSDGCLFYIIVFCFCCHMCSTAEDTKRTVKRLEDKIEKLEKKIDDSKCF